jgi:hypothetical protein
MPLKPLEVVIPEPLGVRDPVPHRTKPRGDEAMAVLSAMKLLCHETGIKQNAEVLGAAGRLIWKCPAIVLPERSASTRRSSIRERVGWLCLGNGRA